MKLPKELRQGKKGTAEGKINKNCSVVGCEELAIRSLSKQKWEPYAEKAKLKLVKSRNRNIFLCKEHYKVANKIRKSDEKVLKKNIFTEGNQFRKGSKKSISPWDK